LLDLQNITQFSHTINEALDVADLPLIPKRSKNLQMISSDSWLLRTLTEQQSLGFQQALALQPRLQDIIQIAYHI
jgi:hypothetical protein